MTGSASGGDACVCGDEARVAARLEAIVVRLQRERRGWTCRSLRRLGLRIGLYASVAANATFCAELVASERSDFALVEVGIEGLGREIARQVMLELGMRHAGSE